MEGLQKKECCYVRTQTYPSSQEHNPIIITFALMNRVALILTFFIGFMIVQPTLAFIDPIFEIEAGEDGCVDEDGDCEGACNPFLSCDTCLGFNSDVHTEMEEITKLEKIEYAERSESLAFDRVFTIFRPPIGQ